MRWPWQHDLDDDLIAELARFLGEQPKAVEGRRLASGRGPQDAALALRESLAVRQPIGAEKPEWRVLQWPEVRSGSWDGETSRLTITALDGTSTTVQLDHPGELPGVFFERVQATILVEERVKVPGGEVLVSGRRQPAGASTATEEPTVVWHAMAIGSTDLSDPQVSSLVIAATERLKGDYEL